MLFTEPTFLFLFLPLLLWAHAACPRVLRNALLTAASLAFYAWGEKTYALIMVASIVFNHFVGLAVDTNQSAKARRALLIGGVTGNLLLLGTFKYANFIVDNINSLILQLGFEPIHIDPVHLPIGISFFTFQSISYVIDIYRGHARAQRSLLNTGLFVSLFPQLIAGPIVRYEQLAHQINDRTVNSRKFAKGVRRFIIGFGKKMIIANTAAWPADQVFALEADELTTALTWIGVSCYTLQIYFDFSGYSDMAIGLGYMLGFRLPENFNYPYIAQSITEFWRRWHITLSRWFRDYLYIPLGGNHGTSWQTYRNLVIVFFLCGLWHGASWAFVVWGLFHGSFLVIERAGFLRVLRTLPRPIRHFYTLGVVMVGWVVFRIATGPPIRTDPLTYLRHYLATMAGFTGDGVTLRPLVEFIPGPTWTILGAGVLGSTSIYRWLRLRALRSARAMAPPHQSRLMMAHSALGTAYLVAVLLLGILMLASDTYNPFIYFQF